MVSLPCFGDSDVTYRKYYIRGLSHLSLTHTAGSKVLAIISH